MPIGTLHFDVLTETIQAVNTLLGTIYVTPDGPHKKIPACDFDVSINTALNYLQLPIHIYDVLPCKGAVSSDKRMGFGFHGPVAPTNLEFGLLFVYSDRSTRTPSLVYRSKEFSIYHAVNTATLITLPRTIPQIADLLTAI